MAMGWLFNLPFAMVACEIGRSALAVVKFVKLQGTTKVVKKVFIDCENIAK